MPPEYQAHGHVSLLTDSFAFGMLAIELLTGLQTHILSKLPFPSPIYRRILKG